MKTLLSTLLLAFTLSFVQAQESNLQEEVQFSTFILSDLSSRDQCKSIDTEFRNMTGVIASRTDLNTRRYFIVYTNPDFNQQWFESYFKTNYGFKIGCYDSGVQGVDRPVFNTYQTCKE